MTVLMASVLVLGLTLTLGLGAIGQVLVARNRVLTAAEAGALAAAPVTFRPFGASGSAAEEAARIVRANGAIMVSCLCPHDRSYESRTATVTAQLNVAVLGLSDLTLRGTAVAEFRPVEVLLKARH